jgi:glycosyltransferase involved in cell wall biosynthesis
MATVIIDAYNYGRFINQAIDSVFAQTLPEADREIIVVDDGSTDDTPCRLERYADKIRYIRKENGGQASAFNVGVAASRGDIISFLDADDYFYPPKLERVLEFFSRTPEVGVVYNRYDVVGEAGEIKVSEQPSVVPEGDIAGRILLGYSSGCPSSGISIRRAVAMRINIPEDPFRISADHFYLNILPLLTRVGFLPLALHAYRVHGSNLYLRHPDAGRRKIHSQQREALWNYARDRLGREFFRAEHDLAHDGYRGSSASLFRIYASGVRYVIRTDASAALRLWTFIKLTARLVLPPRAFAFLQGIRDRLRPGKDLREVARRHK